MVMKIIKIAAKAFNSGVVDIFLLLCVDLQTKTQQNVLTIPHNPHFFVKGPSYSLPLPLIYKTILFLLCHIYFKTLTVKNLSW